MITISNLGSFSSDVVQFNLRFYVSNQVHSECCTGASLMAVYLEPRGHNMANGSYVVAKCLLLLGGGRLVLSIHRRVSEASRKVLRHTEKF
jgi:hypothetical protein